MASKFSIVVGILFSIASVVQAEDAETNFYRELAARSGLKVEDAAVRGVFSSEPSDGLSLSDISPGCDPRRFEDSVIGKKITNKQYYSLAKKYFEKCGAELSANGSKGLLGLLKFSYVNYPFLQNPLVKRIQIKVGGAVIPGIIALKEDPRPRPFVIVRCGVFCSADEGTSMKSFMMHLFDQSPFNVLLLANQTGEDYVTTNGKVSMGGWTEGYETMEVGKWLLEKSEYRDRISSLHMMGISLGGNGAVIGAAFNDKYYQDNGRKIFNSVAAVCPVISLRPTLDYLYNNGVVGVVFSEMTRKHFRNTRYAVKDVPELLTDDKIPWTARSMPSFIGNVGSAALNKRGVASTPDSFFKNNNFWNLKDEVKTPLLLWASKDDIVVNEKINTAVVNSSDLYEKSDYVGAISVPYGTHCAFATAYGNQASSALLRSFVLNNSPEFVDSYDAKQSQAWTFGFEKLGSSLQHVSQKWTFVPNLKQVKVDFKIFLSKADRACAAGPWKATAGACFQTRSHWISISALKALGARIPKTEIEAQALTREFNTKVEFRVKSGPLSGTNKSDFFMSWRNHFE